MWNVCYMKKKQEEGANNVFELWAGELHALLAATFMSRKEYIQLSYV